jgi:hypothetical protein
MKISEKKSGAFSPHEEGTFHGVCVDITPLVKQTTQFGEREIFRIVFETDAPARSDGSRQCVWSRGFTPSLHEKAALRKFLRQWMGRDLTAAELAEFDTEALIGKPCQLVITHETGNNGETYSNIAACTPHRSGEPLKPSGAFVRKKDREAQQGEGSSYRSAAAPTQPAESAESVDDTQAGSDWTKVKVHVGKHKGIELRDLDTAAIEKLASNWLPKAEALAKPTADDVRLIAALKMAQEAVANSAAEQEEEF